MPFIDLATGQQVSPQHPNAIKLETFVFDALPMCQTSIVYETDREDEFAPIKNASGDGVLDSPETSKRLQIERAAAWLAAKGVTLPRTDSGQTDATLEIKATTALYPDDLDSADLPAAIKPGESLLI
ncbi:MAG TPA: hypothetical protein DCZ13_11880 [Porticoccaceae bacterium]|nr:hypothetical protein [Porticoccaceae bacterium]